MVGVKGRRGWAKVRHDAEADLFIHACSWASYSIGRWSVTNSERFTGNAQRWLFKIRLDFLYELPISNTLLLSWFSSIIATKWKSFCSQTIWFYSSISLLEPLTFWYWSNRELSSITIKQLLSKQFIDILYNSLQSCNFSDSHSM